MAEENSLSSTSMDRFKEGLKLDKYVERIAALIKHENELMNNRLTWMLIMQGFLVNAAGSSKQGFNSTSMHLALDCIGLIISLSSYYILRQGNKAIHHLEHLMKQRISFEIHQKAQGSLSDADIASFELSFGPAMGLGSSHTRLSPLLPWHAIPVIMILFWSASLIVRLSSFGFWGLITSGCTAPG